MTVLRSARPGDEQQLVGLIADLAAYEREPDAATASSADLAAALFPSDGAPRVFAEVADDDGHVVGLAVWFYTFSTWTARHGIWLEDLFVVPEHRGLGLGRRLLARLAGRCLDEGLTRLEWAVLDWNEPALGFYRRQGAEAMSEWTTHRVSGSVLSRLAEPR
ncbi:MAG: GNAT family N-acetyltransferase [Propionibacterium sp.]|nr:GNAT family N-acetyltransferase [Propionibacterium sp.]